MKPFDPVLNLLCRLVVCEPTSLETGCWEWSGYLDRAGYGRTLFGGKRVRVHRFVYELFVGPIPEGLVIDHLCRNRACANFEHVEPVTHRVNILRGQGFAAQHALRTHCPYGHPYSGYNLIVYKSGSRACRICQLRRSIIWQKEKLLPRLKEERRRKRNQPEP